MKYKVIELDCKHNDGAYSWPNPITERINHEWNINELKLHSVVITGERQCLLIMERDV